MQSSLRFVLLLALGVGAPVAVVAAENDSWQFEVTPYLFAAGMDGSIGVGEVTADVDLSFSDVLDDLDQAFMGLFSASKGRWTYGLEIMYIKLEDEGARTVTGPFGQVSLAGALEVTSTVYVYQGTIAYRVLEGPTDVDLLAALRYTDLETDAHVVITTDPAIVFPGGATTARGSKSWTDVVVGLRVVHPISERVSLVGYADVGAGGSDLTYQLILGADWAFSDRFSAKLGYRLLDWDYEDDGFVWDITASGPYLGLGIRF